MSDAEDSELRPANDNPWYRLATLYGEQTKGANCWTWDKELAAKNRMAWNRWMARVLSDEQRATLVGKGLPEQELLPLTPAETSALRSAFASGRISPTSAHSGPAYHVAEGRLHGRATRGRQRPQAFQKLLGA
jgi:hypothetical protein